MRIQIDSSVTVNSFKDAFACIFSNPPFTTALQQLLCDLLENPWLTSDDLIFKSTRHGSNEYDHLLVHLFAGVDLPEYITKVMDILDNRGYLDVNRVSENGSPLIFFAVQKTRESTVKYLLNKGAQFLDNNGEFLINTNHAGTKYINFASYISWFNERIIEKHIISDKTDKIGMSVLRWAVAQGRYSTIKKFIRVNPDAVYKRIETKVTSVSDSRHPDTAQETVHKTVTRTFLQCDNTKILCETK